MNLNIIPFKNVSFGAMLRPQGSYYSKGNDVFFKKSSTDSADAFVKSSGIDSEYQNEPTTIAGMRERSMLPQRKEDITPSLLDEIKSMKSDDILRLAGIDVQRLMTGAKVISCYAQPSDEYTYSDLGVDEEELLRGVEMVVGETSFKNSSKTNIFPIKDVHGTLYLRGSKIKNLRSLRYVDDIYLPEGTKAKDFGLRPERVRGKIITVM